MCSSVFRLIYRHQQITTATAKPMSPYYGEPERGISTEVSQGFTGVAFGAATDKPTPNAFVP